MTEGLANIDTESEEKRNKFEEFKKNNSKIIEDWLKTHETHVHPPIYFDDKIKNFRWITRSERRRLKK